MTSPEANPPGRLTRLHRQFTAALDKLQQTSRIARGMNQNHVYEMTLLLLKEPGGLDVLYAESPRFDATGVFDGGDWATPPRLRPEFVAQSLHQRGLSLAIEALSELRLLAIVNGDHARDDVTADEARAFLETVIAFNLDLLFPDSSEVTRRMRSETPELMAGVQRLFEFILATIGPSGMLASILSEADRILRQRPVLVRRVTTMLRTAEQTIGQHEDAQAEADALPLIAALVGPTDLSRQAPSPQDYAGVLETIDLATLRGEARGFAEAMWASGLVSSQHAVLIRYMGEHYPAELPAALGLEDTGRATLAVHSVLVRRLIAMSVYPETAQCVYGLANLLVGGLLFFPPVAPSLWRLMGMHIAPENQGLLESVWRRDYPGHQLDARSILLAGTLSVLGQPLGIGQGDNPTCQAARAISLWAQGDPGYLLELLAQAARDDSITMEFEGEQIRSSELAPGMAAELHTELDAVSLVLVPHLDRQYAEMSRRVAGRGDDGHKWINPEFHGWQVYRGFSLALDPAAWIIPVGQYERFVRMFYASYHPLFRGEAELIYPQPVGIAATDHGGFFFGWHAIAIQRVLEDAEGIMRVYFFNPNNDSGQDWGQGVVTSTSGHGEIAGESSLPFEQFAARLYLFHYNVREHGDPELVPADTVARVTEMTRATWGASFPWIEEQPAEAEQNV